MKISMKLQQKLICPSTKAKLQKEGNYLVSVVNPKIRYPLINGIPILINNEKSIFSIDDFKNNKDTTFIRKQSKLKKKLMKLVPTIGLNIVSEINYDKLCSLLPINSKILIIGGSIKGQGMDSLYSTESFDIVGSDVSFGPCTTLICDAHDIPFEDNVFDCVIIQAVLEHVLDPNQCVREIYRILNSDGVVYAEVPFMQQVHMKQYDFTRYTHLGLKRMFRHFDEIDSGPVCGPGMALAWSYAYFLKSFSSKYVASRFLQIFAHMTSFFLKYFDYYLINKPGSYDAASGFFFMGSKSKNVLSDRELIKQYRGIK